MGISWIVSCEDLDVNFLRVISVEEESPDGPTCTSDAESGTKRSEEDILALGFDRDFFFQFRRQLEQRRQQSCSLIIQTRSIGGHPLRRLRWPLYS